VGVRGSKRVVPRTGCSRPFHVTFVLRTVPAATLTSVAHRFVAVGDSFTEGVGDRDERYPNGVRGWADRVANQLAKSDPDTEYANLALRSRTLDEVVGRQLDDAIVLEPTLVSFFAGGNDLLQLRSDVGDLLDRYEDAVARLAATGARVLTFTSYDLRLSPLLEPLRLRNNQFNRRVRQVALEYDAILIDHWAMRAYEHPRMWEPDRLHMSRHGHRYLAAAVLRTLRIDHTITLRDPGINVPRSWREALAAERDWWSGWVRPMIGRRIRNTPIGAELTAKWPDPIRPADGMKRLAAQQG
jgi:lysophospholipase L1-like esterase